MKMKRVEYELIAEFISLLKEGYRVDSAKKRLGIYQKIHLKKLSPIACRVIKEISEETRINRHLTGNRPTK